MKKLLIISIIALLYACNKEDAPLKSVNVSNSNKQEKPPSIIGDWKMCLLATYQSIPDHPNLRDSIRDTCFFNFTDTKITMDLRFGMWDTLIQKITYSKDMDSCTIYTEAEEGRLPNPDAFCVSYSLTYNFDKKMYIMFETLPQPSNPFFAGTGSNTYYLTK